MTMPDTETQLVMRQQDALATGETHATAQAAMQTAQVQARYAVAYKRPRNIDDARTSLLKECKRPGFAAVARYRKPIGQGVEGPSIRFVEAAIQCMGNMYPEVDCTHESERTRILRVSVTDLETNNTYAMPVVIEKVVERQSLRAGQVPRGQRTNSYGKQVFLVDASEDDLLNKQGAMVSKAVRTLGLRLIPGWLVEEAQEACIATMRDEDAKDPDEARRKLVDGFAALGVKAADLAAYMGHDLGGASPAELAEVRAVYATLRDGESTWAELLAAKNGRADGKDTKASELTEKVKQKMATMQKNQRPRPSALRTNGHDSDTREEPSQPGREPGED